jgi:putative membrane protein
MYTGKEFKFIILWHFARKIILQTFLLSLVVVILYKYVNIHIIGIPFLPIATIGTAVAFFVGFKNNQAYDRLWEARKLWGGIVNTSRNLSMMMLAVVDDKPFVKDFLYRHIAYINILRLQLRKTIPWATSKLNNHQTFVTDADGLEDFEKGLKNILQANDKLQYFDKMKSLNNGATYLLNYQINQLSLLKKNKIIDDFEHSDLVKQVTELMNLQGGCERIKNTPLFRQYSIFSRLFVNIFLFLLPFGMIKELDKVGEYGVWLTIPFAILISWVFNTMEQIGEFSENPFDNAVNDIPISSICRNIEIDIKELLEEENLPPKMQPIQDVLL